MRLIDKADSDKLPRKMVSIFDDEWLGVRVRAEMEKMGRSDDLMPKAERRERDRALRALRKADEDDWDWAKRCAALEVKRDGARLKRMPLRVRLAILD